MNEKQKKKGNKGLKFLFRFILLLIILLIALPFIVQIPAVQNWVITKTAIQVNKKTGADLSIERFYLDYRNDLSFENFILVSAEKDTICDFNDVAISFKKNLFSVFDRKLNLKDLTVTGGTFKLQKKLGENQSNIEQIISKLLGESTNQEDIKQQSTESDTTRQQETVKDPFELSIEKVILRDIFFWHDNQWKGNNEKFYLPECDLIIESIDMEERLIVFESLSVSDVLVDMIQIKVEESEDEDSMENDHLSDATNEEENEPLRYLFRTASISNGILKLINHRAPDRPIIPGKMDYSKLDLTQLDIQLNDFMIDNWNFSGSIDHMSAMTSTGFKIDKISTGMSYVGCTRTDLNDIKIITANTTITDTIIFKYRDYEDFKDFENRVIMDLRLKNAVLLIDDLTHFVPTLATKPLFEKNRKKTIYYDGILSGRINNLRGKDVSLRFGESLDFKGQFSTRNLTQPGNELFNFEFESLVTTTKKLEKIVPNLRLPPNFSKLGRIEYEGYFDGLLLDFVSSGDFKTDIGVISLDMRLDLKNGRENARYAGTIYLDNFDVERWSSDSAFGKTTLKAYVKDGRGLTIESIDASLNSDVQSFEYKGHVYQDFKMEGNLSKNLFNGNLEIQEEHADFSFAGVVDFSGKKPDVDFAANIENLNLYELNLSENPLTLKGNIDIDLIDLNIDSAIGSVVATDFSLDDGNKEYIFEELEVRLAFDGFERIAVAKSDKGKLKLNGDFKLTELAKSGKYLIKSQYPEYFDLMNLKLDEDFVTDSYFNFSLDFSDTDDNLNLLGAENLRFYGLEANGVVDNRRNGSDIKLRFDTMTLNNIKLTDIQISQSGQNSYNLIGAYVGAVVIGKFEFNPTDLEAEIEPERIVFSGITAKIDNNLPELDLYGELSVTESGYRFHFDKVFEEGGDWKIRPNNRIEFVNDEIHIEDFVLSNEDYRMELVETHDLKGIKLDLVGVDFSVIDDFWDYDKLDFNGRSDIFIHVRDLKDLSAIDFDVSVDTLFINGDNFGMFNAYGAWVDNEKKIDINARMSRDSSILTTTGSFFMPEPLSEEPMEYVLHVDVSKYPFEIAEYFLNGISEVEGDLNAHLDIISEKGKPVPKGQMTVDNGYLLIDYLKTGFFVDKQTVKITKKFFDATGAIITDELGNPAKIEGGMRHRNMKDLFIDARITSDELLVLNTKKGDNELFYGRALGDASVDFVGPVEHIQLDVKGTSLKGTKLFIPLNSSSQVEDESSFVRFIDELDSNIVINDVSGGSMDVSLDLIITDQAEIEIIFDEKTGDILKGRGRANLSIDVTAAGSFEMYGEYIVEQGEYLFTQGFINKPFVVDRGGIIRWSGDPLAAEINITARYEGLKATMSSFLSEYLANRSDNLKREAQTNTQVDLAMHLTGSLLSPDIGFNISFPVLSGELAILAESKLRILETDEQQLNEQVFGLIAFGTFLPNSGSGSGLVTGIRSAGINTISEFISNQVSILVSKLLGEAVDNSDFISGLDFRVGLTNYQDFDELSGEQLLTSSEVILKLKPSFLNDRLILDAGANIVSNSPISSGTFIGEDVIIEYLLRPDGRFKLRAYQRSEETLEGRKRKFGIGFSYRKEFNTFDEFFKSSQFELKKILEESQK